MRTAQFVSSLFEKLEYDIDVVEESFKLDSHNNYWCNKQATNARDELCNLSDLIKSLPKLSNVGLNHFKILLSDAENSNGIDGIHAKLQQLTSENANKGLNRSSSIIIEKAGLADEMRILWQEMGDVCPIATFYSELFWKYPETSEEMKTYRQRVEKGSPLEKLREKEGHNPKSYWEEEVSWDDFMIYTPLLGLALDLAKSKQETSLGTLNRLIDLATQIQPESSINNNGELLVDFFKYQLKNTGDWPDIHNKYKDHFVLSNFTNSYMKTGNRMLDKSHFRGTACKNYPNCNYGFYFERSGIGIETIGIYKECEQEVYEGGGRWNYHLESDYDPDSSYCSVYFD